MGVGFDDRTLAFFFVGKGVGGGRARGAIALFMVNEKPLKASLAPSYSDIIGTTKSLLFFWNIHER